MEKIGNILKKRNAGPGQMKGQRFPQRKEAGKTSDFILKFEKAKVNCFHVQLPFDIIDDPVLNVKDGGVLATLERYAWPKDICCPTIEQLKKKTKLGQYLLYKSLNKLKKYHYIEWKRTECVNIYLLLWKNADPEKRLAQFESTKSSWLNRIVGSRIDSPLPRKTKPVEKLPSRRRRSFH